VRPRDNGIATDGITHACLLWRGEALALLTNGKPQR